ncbi:hypothetical protein MHU86_1985 [Fragilaria crotonensis]|nr:hypothetical protein MHU86_1985 [Fragilaria crotonensis]
MSLPSFDSAKKCMRRFKTWISAVLGWELSTRRIQKLPPSPLALNEMEIEKFGLEELGEEVDFSEDLVQELMNEEGVIVDTAENEKKAKAKGAKIDKEQLQAYMDLRPDDMVKVIGDGKFKGEDGIVKRLKNGKLMIRFFTYGSTYEEWLDPKDVRKLSAEEALRGLSGPSMPVTQHDLEGSDDMRDQRSDQNGSGGLRRALMSNVSGNRGPRNTRFETIQRGDRYKRDVFGRSDAERKNEEKKWSRDQDQQGSRAGPRDAAGVNDGGQRDLPMADVDSQWGRYSQREDRRDRGPSDDRRRGQGDERRPSNSDKARNPRNDGELQRVRSALDGGDWNAFVSPSPSPTKSPDQEDDAFFRIGWFSPFNANGDRFVTDIQTAVTDRKPRPVVKATAADDDGDDFFANLEKELSGQGFDRTSSFAEPVAPGDDLSAQLETEAVAPKARESKDWNGDLAPTSKAKSPKVSPVSGSRQRIPGEEHSSCFERNAKRAWFESFWE